ncbi:MAG: CRISPR-associated endonuclease Cas3'' [Clostridia bacterium]|nr:CRISPR-associated endonuclease Cas3'' [Clostridia bacterium]
MQDSFPAHIRCDDKGNVLVQSVSDHLRNTARSASSLAEETGLSSTLKLAGLLHDMGKYSDDFKEYITKAFRKEKVVRGSVNHTFAGVQYLLNEHHAQLSPNVLPCEIIAYACGAHHGLFDCVKDDGTNEFERRRLDDTIPMQECRERFNQYCASDEEMDLLYIQACDEINGVLKEIKSIGKDRSTCYFLTGMLTRLICSFLIEGDRRDTASFMNDAVFSEPVSVKKWEELSEKVDLKINRLSETAPKNGINHCRETISQTCKEAASLPSGIFRLNVPTGAGKTLSSLRYALNHAARHGKRRIIFTTPLLSILEQNADVIKNTIEDDEIILEHHSNLVIENETEDVVKSHELLVETWDSPIIITTLVQLLNTMFSGTTSSIRRFRSLCNSVVVIDEVQTVPRKMLSLFNLAISFLAKCCHTTFVLCSATQPLLEEAHRPILTHITDMVPWEKELWEPFHRTDIVDEHGIW